MSVNSVKQDEQSYGIKKSRTMLRLFRYLLHYRFKILIVFGLMACSTVILIINPLIVERIINVHIAEKNVNGVISLSMFGIILNIFLVLMIKARLYIMATVSNDMLVRIRGELYEHIQSLGFHFFDSRPTGKILARIIGDVNSLRDIVTSSVTTLLPDAITIIAVAVIMLSKNLKLGAAALSSLPFMILAIWLDESASHKCWQAFRKKSSNLNAFIHEGIAGIRVVQSLNAEEDMDESFCELVAEHQKSFNKACRFSDFFGPIIDLSWSAGVIAMYFVGVLIVGAGKVPIGTLVAFETYIGMFWQPVMNLSNYINQMITNIAAAERIFEVLDTKPEIVDQESAVGIDKIQGEINFEDVSFDYDSGAASLPKEMDDEDDQEGEANIGAENRVTMCKVLNHVSFRVKQGETIALVGPTGAGKSTIVNLIARFYDVCGGRILIDGIDVRDIRTECLRSQLGVMTQDNFLFTGTVRENIRYGRLDATDEEIEAAAKAVNAHEFIMQMEKGYDTELKERGAGLSAGQRQLLAFARTFVSNPSILILDEATSSVDTHTEQLVQQGIEMLLKGRTSFVIAHRLSTVRNADRIFVVDRGGIVESGTPKELMEKKGEYYKLYTAQASLF